MMSCRVDMRPWWCFSFDVWLVICSDVPNSNLHEQCPWASFLLAATTGDKEKKKKFC